jgi:hypothetical protein
MNGSDTTPASMAVPDASEGAPPQVITPLEAGRNQDGQNVSMPDSVGGRPRLVPYGALAEERYRRKELQRELQNSFEARQQLQDLVESLRGRDAAADGQADGAETQDAVSEPEHSAPMEDEGAFRTQVLQSVRSYARERPDFVNAYHHARDARIEELSLLGYSREEAAAITFDNELEVIRNAYASGRNPAQLIYDYAVRRGYSPAAPQTSRPQAPVARPVAGQLSAAEKVALAMRGQAGSKSLSSAGGGVTSGLSLEALAGLSDEEFAEATRGDRWQRLLRS